VFTTISTSSDVLSLASVTFPASLKERLVLLTLVSVLELPCIVRCDRRLRVLNVNSTYAFCILAQLYQFLPVRCSTSS